MKKMQFDRIPSKHAERWGGNNKLIELKEQDGDLVGTIPLMRLIDLNPFDFLPWPDGQYITKEGVTSAIWEGRLEPTPYSEDMYSPERDLWTSRRHEERIAYLIKNNISDPITLEFSHPDDPDVLDCDDGNHRLAAAFYCMDEMIEARIGGHISHAVFKLGAICRASQRLDNRRSYDVDEIADEILGAIMI